MRRFAGQTLLSLMKALLGLIAKLTLRSEPLKMVLLNALKSTPKLNHALFDVLNSPEAESTDVLSGYRLGISPFNFLISRGSLPNVSFVITVHNSIEDFTALIDQIRQYGLLPDEVIIVDDASSDAGFDSLFDSLKTEPVFKIIRNEVNLGYTKSVNQGILASRKENDLVLLNSDTLPPSGFWQKLRFVAYSRLEIGTVTPLSNNSGAFSAPRTGHGESEPDNTPPDAWDWNQMSKLMEQSGSGELLEIASCNGFCVYIKRKVIDEVGLFDEKKFPVGYGEENDFSMRASELGWKNILTDKVYVPHLGSKSFGSKRRKKLTEEGIKAVRREFPNYDLVNQKIFSSSVEAMKERLSQAYSLARKPMPRILVIQPIEGGGSPYTTLSMINALKTNFQFFTLERDQKNGLSYYKYTEDEKQTLHNGPRRVPSFEPRNSQFDANLIDFIFCHSIEIVHIESFQGISQGFVEFLRHLGVKTSFSIHDYHSICPSTQLLDEKGLFCGGFCTKSSGDCSTPTSHYETLPGLKNMYVHQWKRNLKPLLQSLDTIIAPSQTAKKIFGQNYPSLLEKVEVVPHGVPSYSSLLSGSFFDVNSNKLLILGGIGPHKGSETLRNLLPCLEGAGYEVELVGSIFPPVNHNALVNKGPYSQSSLVQLIAGAKYKAGLILSTWEETYSHVLTEYWQLGLPVIAASGSGAPEERIALNGGGVVIEEDLREIEKFSREVLNVLENRNKLIAAKEKVEIAKEKIISRPPEILWAKSLTSLWSNSTNA